MPGRRPLPVLIVQKVRLLLARGWAHRRIAEELSIGKGSVQRIAHGVFVASERLPRPIVCPDCGQNTAVSPCHSCGLAIPIDALGPSPDADRTLTASQRARLAKTRARKRSEGGRAYTTQECTAKYVTLRVYRDPRV